MVSLRCRMIVSEELKRLDLHYVALDHGHVEIMQDISEQQREELKARLLRSGLEVLDGWASTLMEKTEDMVTNLVHLSDEIPQVKLADYISTELACDYKSLADLFSEVKGVSIEQFIITNKIERVKELLLYDELGLQEISGKLKYSNVDNLAYQFRKITGLTPLFYKQLKNKRKKTRQHYTSYPLGS